MDKTSYIFNVFLYFKFWYMHAVYLNVGPNYHFCKSLGKPWDEPHNCVARLNGVNTLHGLMRAMCHKQVRVVE